MNTSLEMTLAFHCAPALAGIKPANLISLPYSSTLLGELVKLEGKLKCRGIRLRLLCECGHCILLLVYRAETLNKWLAQSEHRQFLVREGYPQEDLEKLLDHLAGRIRTRKEFPHEAGLFLGYPLADVIGFQTHKGQNCKLCGYWKVYGDEAEAKRLFEQYEICRDTFCRRMSEGSSLAELLRAVS